MHKIFCDPALIISNASEDRFFWPDTPDQQQIILDKAEEVLLQHINDYSDDLSPLSKAELTALFGPIWLQLITKLMMAATTDRAGRLNYQLDYEAATYPFWDDYQNDRPLKDHSMVAILLNGPRDSEFWRWIPRILRTWVRQNYIRRYPPIFFKPHKYFAVTSNLDIVHKFCLARNRKAFYLDADAFFSKIPTEEAKEKPAETVIIDAVSKDLLKLLDQHESIREVGRQWLRRQIAITITYGQKYVTQALSKRDKLPHELIGNLGGVWNGLLRYAVKKAGGAVHILDHGCGSALFKSPLNNMTNFSGVSHFHAFTSFSEEVIRKNLSPQLSKVFEDLRIGNFPHKQEIGINTTIPVSKKSILVVPLSPLFDRGLAGPYPATAQAIDFNIRLTRILQNLGWLVTLKPHPAFMEFKGPEFESKYGAKCETRPFEEVYGSYAAILNCDFSSSTLIPSLYSDKPLILINANPGYFDPSIADIISKRAEVSALTYSPDGRIVIEPDLLANMIEAAMVKVHNKDYLPLFQET